MWRSYVGVSTRASLRYSASPILRVLFDHLWCFYSIILFIIQMLQVQTCIFTYEDKGCANVFYSDLLIGSIITRRIFFRWNDSRDEIVVNAWSNGPQVFLQMKQERFVSSKRSRACVKRQNAAGGVGNIISNVLKKRNGISRRAPRLLCTLEPGEYSML